MLPVIPFLILLLMQGVNPQVGASANGMYAPERIQACLKAQELWLIEVIQEQQSQIATEQETSQLAAPSILVAQAPVFRIVEGVRETVRSRDGPRA